VIASPPVRRLLAFGRPEIRPLLLSAAAGAMAAGSALALMATSGWLIDRAAQRPATVLALSAATASVRGLAIGRGSFRYLERLLSHDGAFRVLGRVRIWLFEQLEPRVPGGAIHSGRQLRHMVDDVAGVQDLWLRLILPAAITAAASVLAVGIALALLPLAGIVLAGGILATTAASAALVTRGRDQARRRRASTAGELSARIVDLVRGAPDLAAYGAQDAAMARIAELDAELARVDKQMATGVGRSSTAGILGSGATLAAMIVTAVAAVRTGRLPTVDLAALVLLAMAAFEPLAPLMAGLARAGEDLDAVRSVLEVGDQPIPVCDPREPLPTPGGIPAVKLCKIVAGYGPGHPPAVSGFDLDIQPGERVALVGPSGSGKSTVAYVLARFVDLYSGSYTLDGHDVRLMAPDDVRRLICLVPQDIHVFNASIRDNVRLGRPEASDTEIASVLERVGLGSWLASQGSGLETRLGAARGGLSGGEQRRLGVARALLADPAILVIDEPTAHLDRDTADLVLADILGSAGNRSVLCITHDPLDRRGVDRVVAMPTH
jgi:ATP-binding cassette subfamily C protein CydC